MATLKLGFLMHVGRVLLGVALVAVSLSLSTAAEITLASFSELDPETGSTSIPCGADGKCNAGPCCNDPDCPDSMDKPCNLDPNPDPDLDLVAVTDCNSTQKTDIQAVAWNIADDWLAFKQLVETLPKDTTLGECLHERFTGNGEVQCVDAKCNGKGCKMGFGGGLGQKVKIFQTFLNKIAGFPQADRRACYAALLTHEFSHTCEHYFEKVPEAREDAAFAYWKARFPVTSTLTVNNDGCGLD